MNFSRHLLAPCAALALAFSVATRSSADPSASAADPPPASPAEAEPLQDLPSLLAALSESANPRWRQLYRPPLAPRSDRNLGAVALGGVIADIYLAAQAFDSRQIKNLCIEVESHARVLGISDGSIGEIRRLAAEAETEDWDATQKATADLRSRFHTLLLTQRDPDLAGLIEIGFWLRGLEIASAAVQTEPAATDLPLCIGSTQRLKHIAARIDSLDVAIRELPFVVETRAEIGRLVRRWDGTETDADREDVEASHTKLRNLLRRIFEP